MGAGGGTLAAAGSAREVFGAFLRLGLTSFGGPVAHLGYFRRELVQRRGWIDEAYLAAREPVVFAPGYAEYFDSMFAGEPSQYIRAATLDDATLARILCPVALLHGRDDIAFAPSSSVQIARRLPHADLALLSDCSHSVAFERTDVFLATAQRLFDAALGSVNPQ